MQFIIKAALLTALLPLLNACVSSASGVQATFVDPVQFQRLPCSDLISGKQNRNNALAVLSAKQDNARSRAIAYNLLLVVGSGALVRDRSVQIGLVKGEIAALDSNIAQRCGR